MKKFCVLQNNEIVTAYDYPLTGEMALMPVSRLNKMGVLLSVRFSSGATQVIATQP